MVAFRKDNKIKNNFTKITIGLASPEEILERSSGEVLKPETINYRTYKPERDGLFCERIFGPVKDYECHCGKYKRIRYKGIVCDRCGVEVTEKKVRRERMGHISLVVPVAHIWYFKSMPNKIAYLLGIQSKKLDSIIYYEKYVVIQPGIKAQDGVNKLDFLTEEEYIEIVDSLPRDNEYLEDTDPNKFIAKMGAEAVYDLLKEINLDELAYSLRDKANNETSQQRKQEALKRLQVVQQFRSAPDHNHPEYMILKVVPVIPPELRPLVPLDGGRFATSDLNDLYRRVIIRNNRLKKLIEIKAPEVILRNEKRMLQEAVDSLLDNSRKSNAVKSDANRPLKSLSDSLKGKQGRFRQNLLGKRVDYSARSVIIVGPELKMHECGLPKQMAAELYKPFVIRKLIERGIVKTVKSAKKIVDRKDPVVYDILENVIKGHPVLLNRAPTLHRLGIQAFQPKLIEGKAIQLHPLVCTAFNADFDGDQMAVHLPLGNAAILEAQILMLASHNILNPASGDPIAVPSQDMILGLYYMTKERKLENGKPVKGTGLVYYSPEETIIAYNEGKAALQSACKIKVDVLEGDVLVNKMIDTTVGRVLFNQLVPAEVGFINEVVKKKNLKGIITKVIKRCGMARAAQFLDDIKAMGYYRSFKGGLSFNLEDVVVPAEKEAIVQEGYDKIDQITGDYSMGFITETERYQQVVDNWNSVNDRLTETVMKTLSSNNDGFNSVFMMLDSGARGSRDQIRQLSGMRGLMAKPQKSGTAAAAEVIEDPIISNFKEGMSVLEYFISTHGARKGLADTALKTADAGYLTRRLVDVAQDVIITQEDCGTLRGITVTPLRKKDEIVESLGKRVFGRTSVHDVIHPQTGAIIVRSGEEITEKIANVIDASPIEELEVRSVLTCESRKGVCAKCYGRNLATQRKVQIGEAVGTIAAQSIGEPGTQLTLRTFHGGGVAGTLDSENKFAARADGYLHISDLKTVKSTDAEGKECQLVISRLSEVKIVDPNTGITLSTTPLQYGSALYWNDGDLVKKGDVIFTWDPFNIPMISEFAGKVQFEDLIPGVTYKVEADSQTGYEDFIVIESKDKTKSPAIHILGDDGSVLATYNIPVTGILLKKDGEMVASGEQLVKIPRVVASQGDITGGLPRVTELFEARNPSNPAIVSEIDGMVEMGRVKRGNREIIVRSRNGEEKKYQVSLTKQILVQDQDVVKAGTPLSDGAVTPSDILAILGPTAVQEHIVNEVQEVYRLQGVGINDKHFEVIVRQMMRKVKIEDPGDTNFLESETVDKWEFMEENDRLFGKKLIVDAGDSENLHAGQIVTLRKFRDENSILKRKDLKLAVARDAVPATSSQILQGITRASLHTTSFMSAASFQETTRVLNEAAIAGKVDYLEGLKENVIVGHLIPAGTGMRRYDHIQVGPKESYNE